MSLRRLAEDSVQPPTFAFSNDNRAWAEQTIGKYPEGRQQSAVIPLLMRAQDQDGWITKAAIEHIADLLKMPLIRVLEVATFYTQFQLKPVGSRAHIQVCGTTPCMLRGSDALKRVCQERIHPEQFHLDEAGTLSWEEVECLGACVNAPMVMIFKDTYEDLTAERLEEIINLFAAGKGMSVKVGPQIDRHLSAPIGAPTSLTEDPEAGEKTSGPTDDDAPSQGSGAGAVGSETRAGRPTTHAPETDPTIENPGTASSDADPSAEKSASIDLASKAETPGSGSTGGTFQGPTGVAGKENAAENRASALGDRDVERRDGPLGTAGDADEKAVVDERRRVDAPDGSARTEANDEAPAAEAGAERRKGEAEAGRVSEDVLPGPAGDDHVPDAAKEK